MNKKYFMSALVLGVAVMGITLAPITSIALGAAKVEKKLMPVVGMAKFVARGSLVDVQSSSFTLHASSVSKNAAFIKGKDQVIPVGSKTKITKSGKVVAFSKLSKGTKVKVFGVFDKNSLSIVKVSWIKILP